MLEIFTIFSRDTTVKLWDLNLEYLTEIRNYGGHTGSVTCVKILGQLDSLQICKCYMWKDSGSIRSTLRRYVCFEDNLIQLTLCVYYYTLAKYMSTPCICILNALILCLLLDLYMYFEFLKHSFNTNMKKPISKSVLSYCFMT